MRGHGRPCRMFENHTNTVQGFCKATKTVRVRAIGRTCHVRLCLLSNNAQNGGVATTEDNWRHEKMLDGKVSNTAETWVNIESLSCQYIRRCRNYTGAGVRSKRPKIAGHIRAEHH